ncbi:lysosome-associated membrane glycoprotein 5-like, partial [Anthonomus grandis grandis]|uniref:lysosome-associated membrane glycoprotein 5-like n=1 Tax=Anthonomus grandis grandis TaxID=2921223 RepID=UPI0021663951
MARMGTVYFQFFVICTSLTSLTQSIELSNNKGSSKPIRPRTSTPPSLEGVTSKAAPVISTTPKDDSGVAIYRVLNRITDTTCILLKTDALVEVTFKLHKLDEKAASLIPEKAMIDGDCGLEERVTMNLVWSGYKLTLSFKKTPGGELWYINNVELDASVDLPEFHGILTRDKTIRLYNDSMLLPTPVGRSFLCNEEVEILLKTRKEDRPPQGVRGSLLLRALQLQPFMYRSENFSRPFECNAQRSF